MTPDSSLIGPFLISKSRTPAHPARRLRSKLLIDSRFKIEVLYLLLPHPFHVPVIAMRFFFFFFPPVRDKYAVGRKEKKKKKRIFSIWAYLSIKYPAGGVFGGEVCAGGKVIKLWVWGSVQHSQTTLMPYVAICQNELWSRILWITLCGGHRSLASPPASLLSRLRSSSDITSTDRLCVIASPLMLLQSSP